MYGKNEVMNMDNEASKQTYFKPIEVKQSKRLQTSHKREQAQWMQHTTQKSFNV